MSAVPEYEGASGFLRWSPRIMLVLAVLVLASRWNHSIQFAALFAFVAFVHARWLPCQFVVFDEGIALRFPFGRRRFLWKEALTVRVEVVGAIALVGRHRRFGYPLMDKILYEPGREELLRQAFVSHGYRVT